MSSIDQAAQLLRSGRVEDAAAALRSLQPGADELERYHVIESQIAAASGDDDGAVAALRQAVASGDGPQPLVMLAGALLRLGRRAEAIDALRSAVARAPRQLQPLRMLGTLCHEQGLFGEALDAWTRLAEARPRSPEGHLKRGAALQALGRVDEAEAAYVAATECKADAPEAWLNLGTLRQDRGDMEGAIEYYERVLAGHPDHAAALANLAQARERLGDATGAREAATRATTAEPGLLLPRLLVARLDAADSGPEAARAAMEDLLSASLSDEDRGHVRMQLGKAYDQLGDHASALACFREGWSLLTPSDSPAHRALEQYLALLDSLRSWPDEAAVSQWSPAAADDGWTPVFLLGFPRSGNTLAEQVLGAHPSFVTSDERQILLATVNQCEQRTGAPYPGCLATLDESGLRAARQCYREEARRQVGGSIEGRRLVDKQPFNIAHLAAVRRIFPEAPVIVAIRDPRDACLSLFMQDIRPNQGALHLPDFECVIDVYERMMSGYLANRERLGLRIIEYRYEDLVDDLEGQARRLLEFLKEPWSDACLAYHEHARRSQRSNINIDAVTQPIYTQAAGRWRRYDSLLSAEFSRLSRFIDVFGYGGET
ncbi:MAG: sulfotransferase [Phycisphaerales bacterium]